MDFKIIILLVLAVLAANYLQADDQQNNSEYEAPADKQTLAKHPDSVERAVGVGSVNTGLEVGEGSGGRAKQAQESKNNEKQDSPIVQRVLQYVSQWFSPDSADNAQLSIAKSNISNIVCCLFAIGINYFWSNLHSWKSSRRERFCISG